MHHRAVQAARRMVAQGERPGYRLVKLHDGRYGVDGLPGLAVTGTTAREASDAVRTAIAEVLEVPAEAFDVSSVATGSGDRR
jgi:hypothetical protein